MYFSQLKGALSSREREIASLRRQLDQSQEELSAVSRDREVALRENRRLQDDLATMTRENQVHTNRHLLYIFFFFFLPPFQMIKVNPLLFKWPVNFSHAHILVSVSPGCACRNAGSSEWKGWTEAQSSLLHLRGGTDRKPNGCQGEWWRGKTLQMIHWNHVSVTFLCDTIIQI